MRPQIASEPLLDQIDALLLLIQTMAEQPLHGECFAVIRELFEDKISGFDSLLVLLCLVELLVLVRETKIVLNKADSLNGSSLLLGAVIMWKLRVGALVSAIGRWNLFLTSSRA